MDMIVNLLYVAEDLPATLCNIVAFIACLEFVGLVVGHLSRMGR